MAKDYSPEEINALIRKSMDSQRLREEQQNQEIIDHFATGGLPTPERFARVLAWRGTDRERLLRHHPFWKEWKMRDGFDALVSTALAAHMDLVRCEAALTAFASSRDRFDQHIDYTVANPAQKEVMAFAAAYFGTLDTLRRVQAARPELEHQIDELRKKTTSIPDVSFVLSLRKNLSHGSVIVPGWSVSSDHISTSGAIIFLVDELLASGSWTKDAREFLMNVPKGRLQISQVTGNCAQVLAKFRRELHALFQRNRSQAEADFYDIRDVSKRMMSRQWLKVFFQGHANRGTDPYPHLHRFFSPEVVRHILRLPPHTSEQVEFVIAQRLAETDCDDELRVMLYKLFGVPNPPVFVQPKPSVNAPPLADGWRTTNVNGGGGGDQE